MSETKTIILDTAERLFAKHGVRGVSVRTVLKEAGVNIALAHYHFGGRDGLIREVLRRRFIPLNKERLRMLDEVELKSHPAVPSIEAVLRAFLAPLMAMQEAHPDFARLSGRLHVTADDGLRWFFLTEFGEVLYRFSNAIKKALPPGMTDVQRHCRALFIIGVVMYTLTNSTDLKLMAQGRYEMPRSNELLEELVSFCTAGLTAGFPAPKDKE